MSRFLEGYTPSSSGSSVGAAIRAGLDSLRTGISVDAATAAAQRSSANAIAASVPGTRSGALSAARNPVNTTASKVSSALSSSGSGGGGGGGGGGGVSSSLLGFTSDDSGKIGFADPNMQAAMDMINQISQANNEWSAQQAQKQMDFQKEMSNTAHQREVADLKAAGLNPVLSAGGTGASTPNGAMGQTDESNTRLIAELAYSAIDALGMSAAAFAGGSGGSRSSRGKSDTLFGKLSDAYASDKLVKKLVDTGLGAVQYATGGIGLALGRKFL